MTALVTTALAWIGGNRRALAAAKWAAIALTVLLFLLSVRRSGERAGRLAERLATMEKTHDVQRQMLEAAARRPRDRDELADRLRDGRLSYGFPWLPCDTGAALRHLIHAGEPRGTDRTGGGRADRSEV